MKNLFIISIVLIISNVFSLAQSEKQVAVHFDSQRTSDSSGPRLSQNNKIIFVNVNFMEDKVALNNVWVMEGKLKRPKIVIAQDNQIYYSVFTRGNEVIIQGRIQDPLQRRYEYVDDDGQLKNIVVTQDSTDILIRIPYHQEVWRMEFSKVNKWSLFGWTIMKRKQNIGTVFINLNEVNHGK